MKRLTIDSENIFLSHLDDEFWDILIGPSIKWGLFKVLWRPIQQEIKSNITRRIHSSILDLYI